VLDERSLRRENFENGIECVLCDGQKWTFPPVRMRLVPKLNEDGSIAVTPKQNYSKEIDAFLNYEVKEDEFQFVDWMQKRCAAAVRTLLRNYDLTSEQVSELLYWEDTPDSDEMWKQIDSATLGIVPKVSADGSSSPS
jgi:hypothetical protein